MAQDARRVIAEAKQRPVIRWVTKNVCFQISLCLGRHFKPLARLHLPSLAP
jgi:hypothetical protein